ncbi:MAG: beta-lactamase family protein, partial [Nonlabens sp.]|nr:beta-lactamase family protein [Nonlabens sp.]
MKNIFTFLALLFCAFVINAQVVTDQKSQKINDFINYLESNSKLIGSIAITENGAPVYDNSFGYTNLPASNAPAANQQYQIGSISKMVT